MNYSWLACWFAISCLAHHCIDFRCLELPFVELALSCLLLSLPCLVLSCLVLPCLALPWLALPCLTVPCLALPCLAEVIQQVKSLVDSLPTQYALTIAYLLLKLLEQFTPHNKDSKQGSPTKSASTPTTIPQRQQKCRL